MRLLALAILFVTSSAFADDRAPRRLTDRTSMLVSFEQLLGVSNEGYVNRTSTAQLGVGSLFGSRIGVHAGFRGGFTIGGLLSTFTVYSEGRSVATGFFAGPRLGWIITGDVVGVWPRLGLNALILGNEARATVSIEAPLTFHVTEHGVILVGPAYETGMGSRRSTEFRSYSLTAGLMGSF